MSLSGINTYGTLPNITGNADADFNDITVQNISVADKLLFEQPDSTDDGNMTTYIFQDPTTNDLVVNNNNPLGGFKIQWGNTPDTSILSFRIDPYTQKLEYPVGNDPLESITFAELNALKGIYTNVSIQDQINTIVDITAAGGGYWGTFFSSIDQFLASANTPTIATLNGFDPQNDGLALHNSVGLGNYNSVKVLKKATYNIQICFQFSSTSSSTAQFRAWFRINGTDVANSSAGVTTHNNNGYDILTFNVIMPLDIDDILTLMFASNTTTQHLEALPAQTSPYTCPSSPSVYLSFQQVSAYQDNSVIVDDLETKVTALEYITQEQTYSNLTHTTTFANALTAGNTVVSRLGVDKAVSATYAVDVSGSVNITGTGGYYVNGVPISTGLTVANNETDNTFYPIFTDNFGTSQSAFIDKTTTPFSINPSKGNMKLANTIKIDSEFNTTVGFYESKIGIGAEAGIGQGIDAVAIGSYSGSKNQKSGNLAFGNSAQYENSGDQCVAIGNFAGCYEQANYSVCIGSNAGAGSPGVSGSGVNSILINAGGLYDPLNNTKPSALFINPIANSTTDTANQMLSYNATTKEVCRQSGITVDSTAGKITATTFAGNATNATNLAGGSIYNIPYQSGTGATSFLPNGTTGQVLTSGNGTGVPTWNSPSIPALDAVVLAGNNSGGRNIYTGPISTTRNENTVSTTANINTSTMMWNGKEGYGRTEFINQRGSGSGGFRFYSLGGDTTIVDFDAPITTIDGYGNVTAPTFFGALSGNATSATNIAGGGASKLVYQTATNTTGFIDNGTAGQVLTSNGSSVPSWVDPLTITDNTFTGINTFENQVTLQTNANFNFTSSQIAPTILNQYFALPTQANNSFTLYASPYTAVIDASWNVVTASPTYVFIAICRNITAYNSSRVFFPIPSRNTYLAFQFSSSPTPASVTISQDITFPSTGDYLLTYYANGTTNNYSGATETLNASISGTNQNAILTETVWCLQKMTFRVTDISTPLTLTFTCSTTATTLRRVCIYGVIITKCVGVNVSDGGITNNQLLEYTGINTRNIFNQTGNFINYGRTLLFGGLELYARYAPSTTLLNDSTYGTLPTTTGGRVIAIGNSNILSGLHLQDVISIGVETCQNVGVGTGTNASYAGANSSIIAIGYACLRAFNGLASTGSFSLHNIFIGYECGRNITIPTGSVTYNACIGTGVLNRPLSTNIQYNALFGHNIMGTSASATSTIQYNSVFGNNSFKLARGANNTSVGYNNFNLATNTATNNNTFLGSGICNTQSGASNVMTNCSFIGSNSDVSASGNYSNSTCLGYNSRIEFSNGIFLGTINEMTYVKGGLNIPVGTDLELNGDILANSLTVTPTQLSFLNQVSANQIPASAVNGAVTSATNIAGGSIYNILYQSGTGTTSFLPNGSTGQVLTSGNGTGVPTWTTPATPSTPALDAVVTAGNSSGGLNIYTGAVSATRVPSVTNTTTVNTNTSTMLWDGKIGFGETDFVNMRGTGNGGFYFFSTASNTVDYTTPICVIDGYGNITCPTLFGALHVAVGRTIDLFGNITANSLTVTPTQLSFLNQVTSNKLPALALEDCSTRTPSIARALTFFGYLAGNTQITTTTTGNHNSAFGTEALQNNDEGEYNTAVGSKAGFAHDAGDYCTYVGYSAGSVNTASNVTIIGASSCTTPTSIPNSTIIGQGNSVADGNTNAVILGQGNTISGNNCGIIGYGITNSTADRIHIGNATQTVYIQNDLIVNDELQPTTILYKKYYKSMVNPNTLTAVVMNAPLYEYNRVNIGTGTFSLPTSAEVEVGTVLRFRRITTVTGAVTMQVQSGSGQAILPRNSITTTTSTVLMATSVAYASVIFLSDNLWAVLD